MSALPHSVPYQASPIKRRHRRTRDELDGLDELIVEIVAADHPMTVRQTFYRMSVLGAVPKDEAGYEVVQRRLVKLRRAGRVAYDWIADSTRWQRKPRTYDGIEDAARATAALYRRALWSDLPVYVEVWCEKDALAGVIYDVTDRYDVPLMVSRGYSSVTYLHEAGEAIRAVGKPTFIYQLGDHDPSGVDIPRKIEAGLREFSGGGVPIEFTRAAVTPEQIERWNLPTRPTKASDSRSRGVRPRRLPRRGPQGGGRAGQEGLQHDGRRGGAFPRHRCRHRCRGRRQGGPRRGA